MKSYKENILILGTAKDRLRLYLNCKSQYKKTYWEEENGKFRITGAILGDWIEENTQSYNFNHNVFLRTIKRTDIYNFIIQANLRGIEVLNGMKRQGNLTDEEYQVVFGLPVS